MSGVVLRSDLEPWTCDGCQKSVYRGVFANRKFYCLDCPVLEIEEEVEESLEVNFEETV